MKKKCLMKVSLTYILNVIIISPFFQDGNTPLHMAAQRGEEIVCDRLLKSGSDVFAKNYVRILSFLPLWTRVFRMQTKTRVCQKSEWSAYRPIKHIQSVKLYLPDWSVCRPTKCSVYIREPSSHYFNYFILLHCTCGDNLAKNNWKSIQNGGNCEEREN